DSAKIDLSDKLRSTHLDSHVVLLPVEHAKTPRINLPHRPPVTRNWPFVIQIDFPMVAQSARPETLAQHDRHIDRPCPQHFTHLKHEVPVNAIPTVLEQDKPRHECITVEKSWPY